MGAPRNGLRADAEFQRASASLLRGCARAVKKVLTGRKPACPLAIGRPGRGGGRGNGARQAAAGSSAGSAAGAAGADAGAPEAEGSSGSGSKRYPIPKWVWM